MRRVTVSVFGLDELDAGARAAAVEAHRFTNVQPGWWETMLPRFVEQLSSVGLELGSLYWDMDSGDIWAESLRIADLSKLVSAAGVEDEPRLHEEVDGEGYVTLYLRGSRLRRNRFRVYRWDDEEARPGLRLDPAGYPGRV